MQEFKMYKMPYGHNNLSIEHNIALTLLKYGVKDVKISNSFIGGHEDLFHLDLWYNNIECTPYIPVLYKGKETPLLWAVAKFFNIKYSGCAGEDGNYMQMGCSELSDWRLQSHTPKSLFTGIYCYFHEMKRFQNDYSK